MIQSHACMSQNMAFEPLLHYPCNFCFLPYSYPIMIWIHQWYISASFVMACSISSCLCLKSYSQFFTDKALPGFVFARLHFPSSLLPAFLLGESKRLELPGLFFLQRLSHAVIKFSLCIIFGQTEVFVIRNLWNFMQTSLLPVIFIMLS